MTPENPPNPPAPPRALRLRAALLLVLALSGWVACLALIRKDIRPSRPRPGAAVVFHIAGTPPYLLTPVGPSAPGEFESFRAKQAALVRRRLTLNTALKQPRLASLVVVRAQPDPVAWLEDGLRVSFDAPELMRVELDGDPEEAAAVLDAVAKAYLADVDERDKGARRDRLQKLEATNRTYSEEVERFHKRMDTIARALGSKNEQTLAVMDTLLKEEFRAAVRELTTARHNLQLAELGTPAVPANRAAEVDGPFARLAAELPPNPDPTDPSRGALRNRETLARARVDDIQKSIEKSNDYRIEIDNLKSLIGQTEKLSVALGEAIERMKVELGAPPRVTLAEDAQPRPAR